MKLNQMLDKRNKETIPGQVPTTNQPLSDTPEDEKAFHYLVSSPEHEEETREEIANTLGTVHISRPSIRRVFFLIRPFLKPILEQFSKLETDLSELVKLLTLERLFLDRPYPISQNVAYTVDYKGRRFLYLLCQQALTIVVNGNNIVLTPGKWTLITFPTGTNIFASGVSDGSPVSVTVRACDYPLPLDSVTVLSVGGVVTLGASTNNIGQVGIEFEYPFPGVNVLNATSGVIANNVATATLTGAVGRVVYLSGFEVTGLGATAANNVQVTITNLLGGITFTYSYTFVAGATTPNQPLIVEFPKSLAGVVGSSIAISCPASGAGGTVNIVNAHGYIQ